MKNEFRYTPLSPLNNLTYAVGLASALVLVHTFGERVKEAVTGRFSDFTVFVVFGFALYLTVFWFWGTFYILLDRYERPAFLFRYRIQTPPAGMTHPSSSPSTKEAVRVVLWNQFAGTLPALVLLFFLLRWMGISPRDPIPPIRTILLKLSGMVLIEEVLFFTAHYTLHWRPLFRTIHHIHHRFRQPIGISTHYVHYAEHLVGNLTPIFAAIVLVRADLTTSFLWVVLAVTNAIHTHSDYAFPWMSWSIDHDFHHYQARGNYGVLGLCDRIFGTDRELRELAARSRARSAGLSVPVAAASSPSPPH
jgi:sterol desaturase/sphingolipid hydroxylase (fatty acid hydroxylase superfamily)